MTIFCINPLSANEQCSQTDQTWSLVRSLVECFEYLLPALARRRVRLLYDLGVEQRRLIPSQHFLASINSIPNTDDYADVKRLWFVYTRNRAEGASGNVLTKVSVGANELDVDPIIGEINEWLIQDEVKWVSFGGHERNEAANLRVEYEGRHILVRNAHHLASFRTLLPQYEASPKHRAEPYLDQDGRRVSPMPLRDDEAQGLLLASLIVGNDRWVYDEARGKAYRFMLTQADIYHGYEVEVHEIPDSVHNLIFQRP